MGLFKRQPEVALAPPKRGRNLTCGALNAALAAVTIELAPDCSARRTFEDLYALTDGAADSDLVKLDGLAPVTRAQLDDALGEAPDEVPAGTLAPLIRVRELIAQAEVAKVAGEPAIGPNDEFATAVWLVQVDEAFHDPHGGGPYRRVARIISHGAASGLTSGQLTALARLVGRIDDARSVLGAAERRREGGRLQVVPGGGGRNF